MKHLLLFTFFLSSTGWSHAQDLRALEDSIALHYHRLSIANTDSACKAESQKMRIDFEMVLTFEGVFEYPFEKLKFCKMTSSDGRIRMFNWNQPFDDGSSNYYCYVLNKNKQNKLYWTELTNDVREIRKPEEKILTPEKWFGALYFDIVPMEKKKTNDTYILLGWQSVDNLTTRKVIDAISVNNGKFKLGAPVFKTEIGTQKRVIYEYNDEVSMSLKFQQRGKHIVLDHLSPRNPIMTGIYSDYGPDGSYDRWVLQKGKWLLESDVDISIYLNGDPRPFSNPRD